LLEDEEDSGDAEGRGAENAIRADPDLTDDQKTALLAVYRSYVAGNRA
jgi:hypothetical protein